jgi:hypothetical protein
MTARSQTTARKAKALPLATDQEEAEYEAGYKAFMLRCMTYAAAHADADDEAWEKHHNFGVDHKPVTPSYQAGYDHARERIVREAGGCGFGMYSPRQQTAIHPAEASVLIPLKGEPGYAEYEAARKARVAKLKVV